jgi:hypothetical protein
VCAGDLEGLEARKGGPFIGTSQEELRLLGLRLPSWILARPPGLLASHSALLRPTSSQSNCPFVHGSRRLDEARPVLLCLGRLTHASVRPRQCLDIPLARALGNSDGLSGLGPSPPRLAA